MSRSPSHRLTALAGLFVLSLLSCGREVTGPDDGSLFGRVADLAVAPSLPGPMSVVDGSGSVVPFNRVRVILQRTNGEELLSRSIDFPAAATEVPLSLEFPLPPDAPRDGLPLLLLLRYLNVAGDTVFAGGPVQVIAQPRSENQTPQEVPVALDWVGPGSEAVRVEIAPAADTVVSGTTTTFTAVAYDALDAVVQGAPIVFSTPDPTIASIGAPGTGSVTWLAVRGQARVIASLPSGEADTALVDVSLPASVLTVVSGNAQFAFVGGALSAPLVLRVEASDAVPVVGIPVTFTVATGGGTLEVLNDTSDANGEVSAAWTLGSVIGAQTVTASFAGLAAPVTLTATAAAELLPGLRTWTGGADAVWSNAANWENGLVPTSLDTVLVTAAATFDPALTPIDSVVISGLTIEDGATIAVGDAALIVVGSLAAPATPSITVGLDGGLGLLGTTGTVQGTLPTVFFGGGAYSLSGALAVEGNLTVINGTFTVDAFPVTVQGDLFTGGTGVLAMLPGSVMTVNGDAIFTGGSTAGFLSGGRLNIGGDFVQSGAESPSSFSADAAHETWFTSAVPQAIQFLTPGTGPTLSHFGTLYSSQALGGTIDLGSDVWVDGALETGVAITAKRFTGAGETIFSRGADIDAAGIRFDGVQWHLLDGAPAVGLQAITFATMDPAVTQWRIARAGGSFTVPGLVFQTVPTGGAYLEVEDTAPTDGNVLTLDVTGVTPSVSGTFTSLLGGAQLIGWPQFAGLTWTGAVSRVWTDPGNYAEGFAPAITDSVRIPATAVTQMPLLTAETVIRALVNENAAPIDIDGVFLIVRGRLVFPVGSAGAACVNGAQVEVQGLDGPAVLQGQLNCPLRVGFGTVSLSGATNVTGVDGTVWISAGGDLVVGPHTLTTTGTVFTDVAGVLTMTDGAGAINALGASFAGGPTTGLLTAGTITLSGSFSAGTNPNAFDASGTHLVRMAGPLDTATVTIGLPASTQFARLEVARPVRLNSETHVGADLVLTATGSLVGVGPLVVDGAITADPASAILVDELFAGGALTLPSAFAVPHVTLTGTGQAVPYNVTSMPYLTITGSAVASFPAGGDFSINPDSIVIDGGELRVGFPGDDAFLDVNVLRTQNGGLLRMQDANASVNVNVAASFAGGSTAGLLTAGQINIYGTEFVQGGGAPDAFAASPGHATRFLGFNGHTASFANPGTGPLTSHFGDLEIALGQEVTAVTLLSDLYAVGTLRTGDNFQRRLESAVPRRVFSNGANVSAMSFSNVSWILGDGEAVTAMDAITFENMGTTAEQLRIERAAGTIPLTTPTFATRPTSGRYVTVLDTDGSGDLVLAVSGATPISHGGYAVAENNAQISGWAEAGLLTWNAGAGDWNNPLAWSPQLVPGPADTAYIPSFANGAPTVATGDTVRVGVLRHEHFTALLLLGRLMVRDSLGVSGSPLSCDGGGVILNDPSGGDIPFNIFSANCTLDIINGTARPTALSQAAVVRVSGDGLLDLNGRRLDASVFSTSERGRLRMVNFGDSLVASSTATFGGQSTDGLLTAGNLVIGGDLQQSSAVSPSSFRATASHNTIFTGTNASTITMQTPGAAASGFGTILSFKGSTGAISIGNAGAHMAGSVTISGGNFTVNSPASVVVVGSLNVSSPSVVTVNAGATLTTAGCSGSGTYTGAGTYVGPGCP